MSKQVKKIFNMAGIPQGFNLNFKHPKYDKVKKL